jgi:hypothetical protein
MLDGSVDNVFVYGEVVPGDGQNGQSIQDYLYSFIRKDINPNTPNTIGGNRDVLDFALSSQLNNNLSSNGVQNDWRKLVNSGMDVRDDGKHNGSAGVTFVSNHDGGGAAMSNVAHAYLLTQPGQTIVYYNADQFDDPNRNFPVAGRNDALGNYNDKITDLVNIRNTHGRGNYRERWLEKEYFAMERSGSMLVVLDNRNDTGVSAVKAMKIDLPVGTRLVELTGNAAAYNATSPAQQLDEVLVVQDVAGTPRVNVRFLHNGGQDKGYLIYGLQTPQSIEGLQITNATALLAGGNPSPSNVFANATTRLADLQVVTSNHIDVRLETQAVTLSDGYRDYDADGDNAYLRVNNGVDTNGNGHIDFTSPTSAIYGFEEFTAGNKSPGFGSPTGNGWYEENIDASDLPEGYNFITVRAFRHRSAGGPAVYSEFKQVVYLDRMPPESEVASFTPYSTAPEDLDLVLESIDRTADSVHVLLDLAAAHTDAEILAMVNGGNKATRVDGGQFKRTFNNVVEGNHVATVVMYEPTGNYSIRRFAGLSPATQLGAGFGDSDFNGFIGPADMLSFENVLYSRNSSFNATSDTNGDGLVDNRDLFQMGSELLANGASGPALEKYAEVLQRRGNLNADGMKNTQDVVALYEGFGTASTSPDFWLLDLNVDGVIDGGDADTLITQIFRSTPGDFDLDGDVDGRDFLVLQHGFGTTSGATYLFGDADLDGAVDADNIAIWQNAYGFQRAATSALLLTSETNAVPEPGTSLLGLLGLLGLVTRSKGR